MSIMKSYGIGIVDESCGDKECSRWLFSFGAYGSTHVLVLGVDILEGALESAAGWLADHAPGHVMTQGSKEHMSLLKEACEEMGHSWDAFRDHDSEMEDETRYEICEAAEADLTYTESGFLTSYEWTVSESPEREEILELQKRHMYDKRGEWYYLTRGDSFSPLEIVKCKRVSDTRTVYVRPSGQIAKVRDNLTLKLRDEALLAYLRAL